MEFWDRLLYIFVGAVVGWIYQQYRLVRSEDVALVNEHIKDIEKFSEAAQAYWLKRPADADDDGQMAAKVRATHAATTLMYDRIKAICENSSSAEYTRLSSELYRLATGDGFEGAGRTLEPSKAIDIGSKSAELVHFLRLQRVHILALRRVWRSFLSWTDTPKPWLK